MDSIKKLTDLFAKFPTVGPRIAGRFVFYLLKLSKEQIDEILNAIQELKNKVKICSFCFNPHENDNSLCLICQNPSRDKKLLCIVEKETDLISIENTGRYKGLYFILGGTITMRNPSGDHLRLDALKDRAMKSNLSEIIIALNPTPEGRATTVLVEKAIKEAPCNGKITHLAKGLPVGGELEYADEETLESAFEGRK